LNLCGIVVAILKMEMVEIFQCLESIRDIIIYQQRHKKWAVKIQHCPISSKFDMWVENDVPTLKNFYQSPFSK
jgi:hypothetical protein